MLDLFKNGRLGIFVEASDGDKILELRKILADKKWVSGHNFDGNLINDYLLENEAIVLGCDEAVWYVPESLVFSFFYNVPVITVTEFLNSLAVKTSV